MSSTINDVILFSGWSVIFIGQKALERELGWTAPPWYESISLQMYWEPIGSYSTDDMTIAIDARLLNISVVALFKFTAIAACFTWMNKYTALLRRIFLAIVLDRYLRVLVLCVGPGAAGTSQVCRRLETALLRTNKRTITSRRHVARIVIPGSVVDDWK